MEWLGLVKPAPVELAELEGEVRETNVTAPGWDRAPITADKPADAPFGSAGKVQLRFQAMNTAIMEVNGKELVHRFRLQPGTFDVIGSIEGVNCRVDVRVGRRTINRTAVVPLAAIDEEVELALFVGRASPPAEFGVDAAVKVLAVDKRKAVKYCRRLTSCSYEYAGGRLLGE